MCPSQYDDFLQKFWEQKRLEEHQQRRELIRPKTTKAVVIIHCVLLFFLLVFLIPFAFFDLNLFLKIVISLIYAIAIIETYGRFLAIKAVECYQHYATEEKRRRCKCVPSCSEYAILCLKKYELIFALLKIRKRLFVTCQGFEYIIDPP